MCFTRSRGVFYCFSLGCMFSSLNSSWVLLPLIMKSLLRNSANPFDVFVIKNMPSVKSEDDDGSWSARIQEGLIYISEMMLALVSWPESPSSHKINPKDIKGMRMQSHTITEYLSFEDLLIFSFRSSLLISQTLNQRNCVTVYSETCDDSDVTLSYIVPFD